MKPQAIHQFVAGFASGDAISNVALNIRAFLRRSGIAAEIYCEPEHIAPAMAREAGNVLQAASQIMPDDIVLLHLSIGSKVNDCFAALNCRKAIFYHNMTPAAYFKGIHEELRHNLEWGRVQAQNLAGKAQVNLAASQFNARELTDMGYPQAQALPLPLDFASIRERADRRLLKTLQDGKTNILFVGRCAPNKHIEDLLRAFYFFQNFVEPDSRLIHAGSYTGLERYQAILAARARNLGLNDVVFAGSLSNAELTACYKSAHLFLCMSEHEGFCIPLLESMANDVPVVAFAAAAVPETMSGAGILVHTKQWDLIAELIGRLTGDAELRESVLRRQRQRLACYLERDLCRELLERLKPLIMKPA